MTSAWVGLFLFDGGLSSSAASLSRPWWGGHYQIAIRLCCVTVSSNANPVSG